MSWNRESAEHENKKWIDFRNPFFKLYGVNQQFERLPAEVASEVNPGVGKLYRDPAGGRIRFSTDSRMIAVRAQVSQSKGIGFDLFRMENDQEIFAAGFKNTECFIREGVFESRWVKVSDGTKMIPYTLNLPYIGNLTDLEIGIDEDARLEEGVPYRNEKPIVFYGSSITQGFWASRPGSSYVSMISQRYNLHYLNFGFAGSAKGEQVIADYMAGLDMCAFICDYDHNAASPKELMETHLPLYQTIRKSHPDIPYIMITRPDVMFGNQEENQERIKVVKATYEYAKAIGDKHVVFVDGSMLLEGDYYHNCTKDGIHPNDLGFYRMAAKISPVIEQEIVAILKRRKDIL